MIESSVCDQLPIGEQASGTHDMLVRSSSPLGLAELLLRPSNLSLETLDMALERGGFRGGHDVFLC
jgi:hypothetical protein